jgi:hypothetical protein
LTIWKGDQMTIAHPAWLRRYGWAAFGAVVVAAMFVGGLELASAIQRMRTAAARSADL